ncbi:MAG: Trk family potassium uptake protein [Clostridia bacterium]|nr:Trk family potassium uptake protein [Clostridia bacterium]
MSTKQKNITPTQIIILGFLIPIAIGTLLLMLPAANQRPISFMDAAFTSVTATTTTGLTTVTLSEQFSLFGQIIILLLMQIGGLGFMVYVSIILMALGKKISLKERILINQSLNQKSLKGMVKLTQKVFVHTLIFELVGALLMSIEFIPAYGFGKGIFYSLFHAVSAFCNAGLNIMPADMGRIQFMNITFISFAIFALSLIGATGFFVWDDIETCFAEGRKKHYSLSKIISKFSVQTKIVLTFQIIFMIFGTLFFFGLEYDNTLARLPVGTKISGSFLHAMQASTSGMTTIDMHQLRAPTKLLVMIMMAIGGAPGSTAGGIKTVTVFVIFASVFYSLIGKKHVRIYGREIPKDTVERSFVILTVTLVTILISAGIMLSVEPHSPTIDLMFDCVSAWGTVGLSTGIPVVATVLTQWILMLLMFIGRVGTITMAVLFVVDKPKNEDPIRYSEENVMIG